MRHPLLDAPEPAARAVHMPRNPVTALALGGLAVLSTWAGGCSFEGPASACLSGNSSEGFITCALNMAPVVQPSSHTREIVYEAPGKLRVEHGQACVTASQAASSKHFAFRIEQAETLPSAYADSATVFMNGWKLRYLNSDHHVQGFGSAIVNIRETRVADGLQLQWEAGGVIADKNGDDPFEWCYSFTIVGWTRSSSGFDAVVGERNLSYIKATDPGNSTALHAIDGLARNVYGGGVVLPQGFAMMWGGRSDRHVLQAGFDLGQHYAAGYGQMAWTSRALFKDNAAANDFYAGQLVSTMTYSSPERFHPAEVSRETSQGWVPQWNKVDLTPFSGSSSCSAVGPSTPSVTQYRVDVPYAYAVPVLSGWELGYVCTDHHVRQLGAAIIDWRFERRPDGLGGTLYYTVEHLLGDDSDNVNYARVSVDVLGMKPLSSGPQPMFGSGDVVGFDKSAAVAYSHP